MNATIERVVDEILDDGMSKVDDPLEEEAGYVIYRNGNFAWSSPARSGHICIDWLHNMGDADRGEVTENVAGIVAAICAGIPVKWIRNGDVITSLFELDDHLKPWPTADAVEPTAPAESVDFVVREGVLDSFSRPEMLNPAWSLTRQEWVAVAPVSGTVTIRDGVATLWLSDGRDLSFMLTRIDFER